MVYNVVRWSPNHFPWLESLIHWSYGPGQWYIWRNWRDTGRSAGARGRGKKKWHLSDPVFLIHVSLGWASWGCSRANYYSRYPPARRQFQFWESPQSRVLRLFICFLILNVSPWCPLNACATNGVPWGQTKNVHAQKKNVSLMAVCCEQLVNSSELLSREQFICIFIYVFYIKRICIFI